MKYTKIEEIPVWNDSLDLVANFYFLLKDNLLLKKDFALQEQMKRSIISVPSNIAEWFARKTNVEFKRFLDIALWSLSEFKTQIYICNKIWYIDNVIMTNFLNNILDIEKQIKWFIKYLK